MASGTSCAVETVEYGSAQECDVCVCVSRSGQASGCCHYPRLPNKMHICMSPLIQGPVACDTARAWRGCRDSCCGGFCAPLRVHSFWAAL
eukprot:5871821-Amphidinium_carterae.1